MLSDYEHIHHPMHQNVTIDLSLRPRKATMSICILYSGLREKHCTAPPTTVHVSDHPLPQIYIPSCIPTSLLESNFYLIPSIRLCCTAESSHLSGHCRWSCATHRGSCLRLCATWPDPTSSDPPFSAAVCCASYGTADKMAEEGMLHKALTEAFSPTLRVSPRC